MNLEEQNSVSFKNGLNTHSVLIKDTKYKNLHPEVLCHRLQCMFLLGCFLRGWMEGEEL